MKALTISQPYASLIASGEKWVENRTWHTSYRGPLAIHAGQKSSYLTPKELRSYPTGVVVATCELLGCLNLSEAERYYSQGAFYPEARQMGWGNAGLLSFLEHEYTDGPWCWILANVKKLEIPIPAIGKQRFWEFEFSKKP